MFSGSYNKINTVFIFTIPGHSRKGYTRFLILYLGHECKGWKKKEDWTSVSNHQVSVLIRPDQILLLFRVFINDLDLR